MKPIISALCATALLMGSVAPALAQGHGHHDHGGHHERNHRHDRHGFHGDRGHHWRGDHRDNNGSALAAGALGFVLGTAIADSHAHQTYAREHMHERAWLNRCEARYKSFDPRSGTYLAFDGKRHYCH